VVTAACTDKVAAPAPVGEGTYIDFAHLKGRLTMLRVLGHLGLAGRLRGSGPQRRCACPIHNGHGHFPHCASSQLPKIVAFKITANRGQGWTFP
jgi:hypothetical protein